MYHINRPKESFIGGTFVLNPRLNIHGGGYVPLDDNKTIHFSAIHQRQGGAYETVAGGAFSMNLNNDYVNPTEIYGGLWYRFGDALIPYLGVEIQGLRLGFSYDINHSDLNTASNSRGGAEISLIYIKRPVDQNMKKLNCPKF
jgi:Type IX secretion system membrane protein PorP/SprF